ncbi:MAG: hypothetical protein LKG11_01460 [Bacilli bacterium]|jgi:hypothetical protein|nr:hypothetical protein [Bacilli bacterium]
MISIIKETTRLAILIKATATTPIQTQGGTLTAMTKTMAIETSKAKSAKLSSLSPKKNAFRNEFPRHEAIESVG